MFNELVEKRRSVRVYEDRPVEPAKIDAIIEAALRSPTGAGARPWQFVVVTDKTLLEKLSKAKPKGAGFLQGAAFAVVVCGDTAANLWIEGCSIAAITMQYAAHALGLGSCWVNARLNKFNEEKTSVQYIAELLGLPGNLAVQCIVAFGYPGAAMVPYKKEELPFDKVSYNGYGRKKD